LAKLELDLAGDLPEIWKVTPPCSSDPGRKPPRASSTGKSRSRKSINLKTAKALGVTIPAEAGAVRIAFLRLMSARIRARIGAAIWDGPLKSLF
jgi:hypothetical protein